MQGLHFQMSESQDKSPISAIYTIIVFVDWKQYTDIKGNFIHTSFLVMNHDTNDTHKHTFHPIHADHPEKLKDLLQGIFQYFRSTNKLYFAFGDILQIILAAASETNVETSR